MSTLGTPAGVALPGTTSASPASRDRRRSTVAFVVAVVVLLVAALGLNGVTAALKLHFRKLPVPLRQPLATIPDQLGPWVCVVKTEVLGSDLEETLGTDKFIFRDYVDSRIVPRDEINAFKDKPLPDQRRMLAGLQARRPQSVIDVAVTYYTGKADTVAHIPDRCYVANGYEPKQYITSWWPIATPITQAQADHSGDVQVRFINFEDETGAKQVPTNVAYFFQTDGHYESDPTRVRINMQNLVKRYAYYAKVEVQNMMAAPPGQSAGSSSGNDDGGSDGNLDKDPRAGVMRDFLGHALPEIEKCLPTAESLKELSRTNK